MKLIFTQSDRISTKRRIITGAVLLVVAFVALFYAVDYTFFAKYKPPCVFRAITGLYCPGCGSSGAVRELLSGHIYAAFRFNMFVVIAMPFLLYFYAAKWIEVCIGRTIPRIVHSRRFIFTIAVLILLFSILRNFSIEPFNYLAPTDIFNTLSFPT